MAEEMPRQVALARKPTSLVLGTAVTPAGRPLPAELLTYGNLRAFIFDRLAVETARTQPGEGLSFAAELPAEGRADVLLDAGLLGVTPPVTLDLAPGSTHEGTAFTVSPTEPLELTILAVDESGIPIADAVLELETLDAFDDARTDANGLARFSRVSPGLAVVRGSAGSAGPDRIARRGHAVIDAAAQSRLLLVLEPSARDPVRGTITGGVDSMSSDVTVSLYGTDLTRPLMRDGVPFTFSDLEPGTYLLEAVGTKFWGDLDVTLEAGERLDVIIEAQPCAKVLGAVQLGGHSPVLARVAFQNETRRLTLRADHGFFSLRLRAGAYEIGATSLAPYSFSWPPERHVLPADDLAAVRLRQPAGDVTLAIRRDGAPVAASLVEILAQGGGDAIVWRHATSPAIEFPGLPAGRYDVLVTTADVFRRSFPIDVAPDSRAEHGLDLQGPPDRYAVTLEVKLPGGAAPAGLDLDLRLNGATRWKELDGAIEVQGGTARLFAPEGTLEGTVGLSGSAYVPYRVGPVAIAKDRANPVRVEFQRGGGLVVPDPGQRTAATVEAASPENPVAAVTLRRCPLGELVRLPDPATARRVLAAGGGSVTRTAIVPPGAYTVEHETGEGRRTTTATVRAGQATAVLPDDAQGSNKQENTHDR
jgi:hypothetical protein